VTVAFATLAVVARPDRFGSRSPFLDVPTPVLFFAGTVGALLILAAAVFVYGSTQRSMRQVLFWSLTGGAFAALGGAVGIGRWTVVVWQVGVALTLALFPARAGVAVFDSLAPWHSPRIIRFIFAGGIIAFFGWQGLPLFKNKIEHSQREQAFAGSLAEAPSHQNLPAIPERPLEQTLISEEIEGFAPASSGVFPDRGQPVIEGRVFTAPPSVAYSMTYSRRNVPLGVYEPSVLVQVVEYPNSDWARYKARYPRSFEMRHDLALLVPVTRFNQRIVLDNSSPPVGGSLGFLYFVWPSSNVVVTVQYDSSRVIEEFLKRYLDKYPSSL
jgi:hypothetical protein